MQRARNLDSLPLVAKARWVDHSIDIDISALN
jgi:hypothetical protein